MNETTVILGATSDIARALAQEFASCGDNIVLAARDREQLETMAKDLKIRHSVQVGSVVFDALSFDRHQEFWRQMCNTEAGEPTRVILCYGYMANQAECQSDYSKARNTIDVNLTSAVCMLELVASDFAERGSGAIAVISSVAGDRGRATNYIYGASKAGLTAYTAGLRNRLFGKGVHVLTIKPGFVDTKMTKGVINPDSFLVAVPEQIARDIRKAMDRKPNFIYTPWFWRIIKIIICSIPESIFKRLKI